MVKKFIIPPLFFRFILQTNNDFTFNYISYIFVGSFSTQIAQSAYDEVKKEVEAEKKAKVSSDNPLSASSADTWEFMGVRVQPPRAVLGLVTGLSEATRRVDTVIADEVSVCLIDILCLCLLFISYVLISYIHRLLTVTVASTPARSSRRRGRTSE